jgi:hypothetical protein
MKRKRGALCYVTFEGANASASANEWIRGRKRRHLFPDRQAAERRMWMQKGLKGKNIERMRMKHRESETSSDPLPKQDRERELHNEEWKDKAGRQGEESREKIPSKQANSTRT